MHRPTGLLDTSDETFAKRIAALLIDAVVLAIGGMAFTMAGFFVANGGSDGMATTFLAIQGLMLLAMVAYFVGLEAAYGQTLGKKAMGIVVMKDDGSDSDLVSSLVRNALRVVDAFPFLYLLGAVAILLSDGGQRIGDFAASTVVVETA